MSLPQMETLEQLHRKFLSLCVGTTLEEVLVGAHTVTFQPMHSRINEDRVVTETWDVGGQK